MLGIPVLGEILSAAITLIPKIIKIAGENFLQFAQIITGVFKALGLMPEEESATDLGDKALQAESAGITPEQYDSYEEYLKAVEKFEVDPEKSREIPEGKKLEKGAEVITSAMIERYGDIMIAFFELIAKTPTYFEQRMPFFSEMQKNLPTTFDDITRYINGKETDIKKADETLEKLFDVEKKVSPDTTIVDLMKSIEKMKD